MKKLVLPFVFLLAIACSANAREIEVPIEPARTPADETLPLAIYDCVLTHVSGQRLAFKFQVTGGRGYLKDGFATRTETTASILNDPAGLFDLYAVSSWDGRELRGLDETGKGFFGEYFVGDIRQADQNLTREFSGRVLMTIGEHRPPKLGLAPNFTATGFCDAMVTPQLPLSEAEIAKLAR